MKTEALFIVVLLLIAPLLFSQENLEETLRWLPGEDYSFIAHYDLEKTRTKSFDSLLKKGAGSGFSHYRNQFLLPDELFDQAASFTCGKYAKVKALNLSKNKKEFENNAYIHTSPNSKVVNIELGEYEFLFKEEGYMLFIYRFIDLDKAVKQAVKRGDFEKTDKAVSGNKVYSFKGTGMSRKKETRFFALQLPAGELLVAPSVKLLVKMYEAGLVPEGTFIRTAKYEFLKNVDSELGSAWCYSDRSLIDRKILEKNEELQGDGEDINMIRNNLESSGEFRLSAVTMGKELRLTSLRVFSDSSVAQGMKEQGDWVVKENYCIKVVATQERSK